jgi:glycosyltransferase involved in cell wall biosynthesis
MSIKVAIDLSPLHTESKIRGIGFYTQRLLDGLKKLPQGEIEIEELSSLSQLDKTQADLIHIPYFSPYSITLPWYRKKPLVVTIHDLIPIKYPQHFPAGVKGLFRWQLQKKLLKKVNAVLTDSEASASDIAKFTGYPKENIHTVYLAADSVFRPATEKQKQIVAQKYQLPKKYVLYVGDVNWNKNVPGLIKACQHLNIPLVLVGKQIINQDYDINHPENKDLVWIQNQIKGQNILKKELIPLGFVPTEDLVVIYSLATLYCQPSFDEGFGLPVLEAMACGCPVVCADTGSLPEIAGSAAKMFNPFKEDDLADSLEKLFTDPQARKKHSQAGLKQASKFSWSKTAQNTLSIYQQTVSR